ncbi:transglycosylase domain-containing protein [Nereida sp. MMG025]|uniref:transglycosylase domain-containing protein n=1 Tax=Nereida sp. MMG025 TaxID=2909981 RepID=UPI001F01C28E|nr:PBP1A family penicillin-binding protein [Nereida sp. MMG025]MCF6444419.1 PBP1A family penicillin-binding protein [Nereida sp. MMG025]
MSKHPSKRAPLVADKRYSKPKAQKPAAKRKPARKPKAPKRSRGPIGWLIALVRWIAWSIWALTWRASAVVALIVLGGAIYFAATLPPMTELVDGRARGSVTLSDRDGRTFAWRGDQFGGMVTAASVSPHLKNAVVATEDKRFYRHLGISPRGVASAVRINLREGRGPLSGNGGSTITQQTAKLLCLGVPYDQTIWDSERAYEQDCRRTTLWRKVKEAVYSLGMELKYSKDEILTVYLNRAYLGAGSRGFEAAAQRYFNKSATDVGPAEAAMLAGLLKAPSTLAPTNNLQRSQNRANLVIGLMEDQGYLTAAQAEAARTNPAGLSPAAKRKAGGYFADWVMDSGPEFFTRNTTEDVLIRTTLDQSMQKAAEDALQFVFETKVREGSKAQAAIIVMSADGAVRAMVGGRSTDGTGAFNRATQAKRQSGSTFKPFVYATALELGYMPNDRVEDAPLCITTPGSGEWCPKNYKDEFRGSVTLTEAFKDSLNIPAVKVSEGVGRDMVRRIATDFGITSDLAAGPALALGASESTLIEMTGAYAGILNGGSAVTPYGLVELRIQGDSEPLMEAVGGIGDRVIAPEAAAALTYMMYETVENGTGRRAKLDGREVAGKTGTTQAARDAWFIGFSGDYVAGVWMGYDDNTPLRGVTGSGLPADIWRETMMRVHQGVPPTPLPMIRPRAAEPAPAPQPQQNLEDLVEDAGNTAERILIDVLTNILRGGNN